MIIKSTKNKILIGQFKAVNKINKVKLNLSSRGVRINTKRSLNFMYPNNVLRVRATTRIGSKSDKDVVSSYVAGTKKLWQQIVPRNEVENRRKVNDVSSSVSQNAKRLNNKSETSTNVKVQTLKVNGKSKTYFKIEFKPTKTLEVKTTVSTKVEVSKTEAMSGKTYVI